MFQHGVDDRQQFAHDGDQGDLRRFASQAQALVIGAEGRVMPRGRQGGHVQDRADRRPAARNHAPAPPAWTAQ